MFIVFNDGGERVKSDASVEDADELERRKEGRKEDEEMERRKCNTDEREKSESEIYFISAVCCECFNTSCSLGTLSCSF